MVKMQGFPWFLLKMDVEEVILTFFAPNKLKNEAKTLENVGRNENGPNYKKNGGPGTSENVG